VSIMTVCGGAHPPSHGKLGVLPSEPQVFRLELIGSHCSGMVVWWVEVPRILGSCRVNGDLGAFF
jgi:hypothetical protein